MKEKLKSYLEEVKDITSDNLKFFDETGANLAMSRAYARSPRGERAVGKVPEKRGQQTTIVGVIGLEGILCHEEYEGAMNEEKMLSFIENKLSKTWKSEYVFALDNLTSHKTERVQKAFEKNNIRYIYLPPYHPELNPIEFFWSKFKSHLKKLKARTQKELSFYISSLFDVIGKLDSIKIFEKCGYKSSKTETQLMAA